ncbi:response regulator [Streptomyces sp. NPDC059718]
MIRVLVVDDEALIRTGFQRILEAAGDIEVVATVAGAQAVQTVHDTQPDLVLLDIRMPDVDGLTILARLSRLPRPPVVAMLTTFGMDEYVAAALRSGAAGFLLKDTDPEELPFLVRALASGGTVLASKIARAVVNGYLDAAPHEVAARGVARLTDRERSVLLLIAQSMSNRDIAARLCLSTGTVKDHVSSLFVKLQVNSRVQAALLAERAGLLRPTREEP